MQVAAARIPMRGKSAYTALSRYGAGCYFASQACKAVSYTRPDPNANNMRIMLVSRVVLGDPHYQTRTEALRRPPERGGLFDRGVLFDSIVANKDHRELIVYDHRQAYPEYIVFFK